MRLLIDTNIFLELLLEQERAEEARQLLSKTEEHEFFLSDFSLHSRGFLNPENGVAVVYDMDADLIATVFKPVEGALFFTRQIDAKKIDRKEWNV